MSSELSCPFCQTGLTLVSRRQDYFCGNCQVAFCLDGETTWVYRSGQEPATFPMATQTLRIAGVG